MLLYNSFVLKRQRILALLFVAVGLANLLRAGMAIFVAPTLADWSLALPLPLLGGFYLLWGLAFTGTAVVIWRGRGLRLALPLAAAYQAGVWVLNLLGTRSAYHRSLWVRDLLLTGAFLGLVWQMSKWRMANSANVQIVQMSCGRSPDRSPNGHGQETGPS